MDEAKEKIKELKRKVMAENCPVNHDLAMFTATNKNLCCYKCRKFTNKNKSMYGCKFCSFYLCWDCYDRENAEEEIEILEKKLEQLEGEIYDPNEKSLIEEMIEELKNKKEKIGVFLSKKYTQPRFETEKTAEQLHIDMRHTTFSNHQHDYVQKVPKEKLSLPKEPEKIQKKN